jgi:glycosyltransferase involved in cell wall biosynthesis
MKKIAILADFPLHLLPKTSFQDPGGHYATWLPQLAKVFEGAKGFEFHWVTLDSAVKQDREIKAWNQTFHVLPTWRRGRAATLFLADRYRIQHKIRQIKPDLVHGWGNENIWGWATVTSHTKNIFSIQGLLGQYCKLGHRAIRERMMAMIEAVVMQKAMVLTAESPWTIQQVERLNGRKDVKLVEYGVPEEFFSADYAPATRNPYAVMVGTADFRKGIDFAVQLFSRPELAGIQLKVVGGITPYGEIWKKTSPENIQWLGRKTQAEIIRLMGGAMCLVLPTRGDTGPTVAKEARVIGLPLVASPHGGHIQYIQDGENGFICRLDDPESWSRAIRFLSEDLIRAQQMGRFQQREHRELLRPEKTANTFMLLYQELVPQLGLNW